MSEDNVNSAGSVEHPTTNTINKQSVADDMNRPFLQTEVEDPQIMQFYPALGRYLFLKWYSKK